MTITQRQYRRLLIFYCALLVLEFLADMDKSQLPPEAAQFEGFIAFGSQKMRQAYNIIGWVVEFAYLVGLVGLFALWGPARHIFLFAAVASHLAAALIPCIITISNGWEKMFYGLGVLCAGVILTLSYTSGAHLFKKAEKVPDYYDPV